MDGVGGGPAVGEHGAARLVERAPVLLVGGVAVDRVEGRCRVGVHVVRIRAEPPSQVHAHERRRGATVSGEGHRAEVCPALDEARAQEARLRLLAGAVEALDHDEPPCYSVFKFVF